MNGGHTNGAMTLEKPATDDGQPPPEALVSSSNIGNHFLLPLRSLSIEV